MSRKPRIPSYRKHTSGQARVTLDGKDYLLGDYDSPESREAYNRLIADWLDRKGVFAPAESADVPGAEPITVNELILSFWGFAAEHYGFGNKPDDSNMYRYREALRVLKERYGDTYAADFGPKRLKECRERMVAEKGWSRGYVNSQVDRIRRVFRWAAEEELLAPSVHQALATVKGLQKGKTPAPEGKKVGPVPADRVEAVLPHLPPTVADMVRLQMLTGCRPGEVCLLRPGDLDTTNPGCWAYRPHAHKTEHHGHDRLVLIGPRAQEVLKPYLDRPADAYCFSPAESERRRNEGRRQGRKTPMTPSQSRRRPNKHPRRPKRDRYDETSYRNAVYRACDRAFPPPEPLARREGEAEKAWAARLTDEQRGQLKRWRSGNRWHPNQLRHSRATELRRVGGLDLAKTVLGHSKVETSQIYAEKDLAAAMKLVAEIG